MAITSRVKTTKVKSTSSRTASEANFVKVAAIQMASGPVVAANLNEAERLIEIAVNQGAKLVVLPEYFAMMGLSDTDKIKVKEQEGSGKIQDFLAKTAKKHAIWLIGGSIPIATQQAYKVRNSCLVYNDKGVQIARYDKIHLFGLDLGDEQYNESNTIEPGDNIVVVDTPFGKIGLSICYDLRFPELYRAMGLVDILVVPAAFTETTGKAHWESLLRARAIENLCYVIAPAQGGYHLSGRETYGNSMIVDPWGLVLDRLSRGSGVVLASVNKQYQASVRSSLPALQHRKVIHAK